jgi:hypothetical protein
MILTLSYLFLLFFFLILFPLIKKKIELVLYFFLKTQKNNNNKAKAQKSHVQQTRCPFQTNKTEGKNTLIKVQ